MDETFHKYIKIKQLGDLDNKDIFLDPEDTIVLEEKLDGANSRFMIHKDGYILFGSHNNELPETEYSNKSWARFINFVLNKINNETILKNPKYQRKIFYGECMIKHSLSYDWEHIEPFLGFDIMDLDSGKYLENKNEIFNELGLPVVPHLKVINAKEFQSFTDEDVPISKYAPLDNKLQKAEGVVFKNYSKQIFAKYVRSEFKEINKSAFGLKKAYTRNDDELIVSTYCTNARIDKCVFKLSDDGYKIDRNLMKYLPVMVYKDIFEENYKDIFLTKYKLDLGNIKNLVAKRCLSVLDQIITNNMLLSKLSNNDKI